MGRVRAPLAAAEVLFGIAPGGRVAAVVLAAEALHRRPRLDQRAVHREVLVRQKTPDPRAAQHRLKEARRNIPRNQPVVVLRIHRRVPHRRVHRQSDEPAEQQVVVQLLHQLTLRTDGVEGLQQKRPQQLLRRDRGRPGRRIQNREIRRQRRQGLVHQNPDRPQRMIRRYPSLQIDVAEQTVAPLIPTPHRNLRSQSTQDQGITIPRIAPASFSATCYVVKDEGCKGETHGALTQHGLVRARLLVGVRSSVGYYKIAGPQIAR